MIMERVYFLKNKRRIALTVALVSGALNGGVIGSACAAVPPSSVYGSANFQATATVNASCVFGDSDSASSGVPTYSIGDLAFGSYDTTSPTDTAAFTSVDVTCTGGANAQIGITAGSGSDQAEAKAENTTRAMQSNGNYLAYEIYQPPSSGATATCTSTFGGGTIWDDNESQYIVPASSTDSSTTLTTTVNICGIIPNQQEVAAGSYVDNLTVYLTPSNS